MSFRPSKTPLSFYAPSPFIPTGRRNLLAGDPYWLVRRRCEASRCWGDGGRVAVLGRLHSGAFGYSGIEGDRHGCIQGTLEMQYGMKLYSSCNYTASAVRHSFELFL